MAVTIEKFVLGPLGTNGYLVANEETGKCFVVDPSSGCGKLLKKIKNDGLIVEAICLTHGHFDHLMGVPEILDAFPQAEVWVHPEEKKLLGDPNFNGAVMIGSDFSFDGPTRDLVEGQCTLAGITFDVYHIPGHSPGGCALVIGNDCLCGDALFASSIGRTDFPLCDHNALIAGIREKLFSLPDETVCHPGHMGRTTIGREKKMNPFLQ